MPPVQDDAQSAPTHQHHRGARAVDEVKDVRDKARAIEMYARQVRNTGAERQACEIRLRAERKCGQLLTGQLEHGGDRRSSSAGSNLKLRDLERFQSDYPYPAFARKFAHSARAHGRSIFGQLFERSVNGLVQAASV